MTALGFRSDPTAPRFAVVSEVDGVFTLLNAADDNKLPVPAAIGDNDDAARLRWLFNEMNRIFDAYQGITTVVIKQNEFTQNDTKAKRRSAHMDAAVLLACAMRGIPVVLKNYTSMPTTSAMTKEHAEARVGARSAIGTTRWPMRSMRPGLASGAHEPVGALCSRAKHAAV